MSTDAPLHMMRCEHGPASLPVIHTVSTPEELDALMQRPHGLTRKCMNFVADMFSCKSRWPVSPAPGTKVPENLVLREVDRSEYDPGTTTTTTPLSTTAV